jgi:xylulokinase
MSSLSGLNLDDNWLAFSLGTSDTIMLSLDTHPSLEHGHVLIHPTKENAFMGLLCFKNGSLVRDTFKRAEANNNWSHFSELLESAKRGNDGYMAIHFLSHEILPNVAPETLRWTPTDSAENYRRHSQIIQFPTQQTEIRALIEGQMLNRKMFAMDMGFNFGEDTMILATGGSSSSKAILQVMSDVFNAPVYIQKTPESACLGSAYRAKYVLYVENAKNIGDELLSYHDYIRQFAFDVHTRLVEPNNDSNEIYIPMLQRYREMVQAMMNQQQDC